MSIDEKIKEFVDKWLTPEYCLTLCKEKDCDEAHPQCTEELRSLCDEAVRDKIKNNAQEWEDIIRMYIPD